MRYFLSSVIKSGGDFLCVHYIYAVLLCVCVYGLHVFPFVRTPTSTHTTTYLFSKAYAYCIYAKIQPTNMHINHTLNCTNLKKEENGKRCTHPHNVFTHTHTQIFYWSYVYINIILENHDNIFTLSFVYMLFINT